MPKISAILPIYNAGDYLRECLDSILAQTLADIEVVCVNDGSTDGSLAVMQEYAAQDARVKVCDYPNGGYGKAMNRGLSCATGEYIAIVEPDDFIDARMYEVLYAHAQGEQGPVDVIKGSYWEYFDASDEADALLVRPALDYCMPDVATTFTLADFAEVFRHHPSIWSALYRREFLEEKHIRFVEPKGAGWADNPFLAATLSLASQICWVPMRGYFYRQTNANASSYLKDFHIPFDRLREMRAVLSDAGANEKVLAAFYERELNYIYDVITTFGFDEADPEVSALIDEVLADMRPEVVESGWYISPENVEYYHMKTQPGRGIQPHEPEPNPLITLLVPVGEGGLRLSTVCSSISELSGCQIECLFLCDKKSGANTRYCQQVAHIDKRLAVVEGQDFAEVYNKAVAAARGTYVLMARPGWELSEDDFKLMTKALSAPDAAQFVLLLPDNPCHDVVSLPSKEKATPVLHICDDESKLDRVFAASMPYAISRLADVFVDWVVATPLAKKCVYEGAGTADLLGFTAQVLTQAESVGYLPHCQAQRLKTPRIKATEPYPAQFEFELDSRPLKVAAALKMVPFLTQHLAAATQLSLGATAQLEDEALANAANTVNAASAASTAQADAGQLADAAVAQFVLKAFLHDLDAARTWQEAEQTCAEYAPQVQALLAKHPGSCFALTDSEALNAFAYLQARGATAYYFKKYILVDNARIHLDQELKDVRDSTTFKVGAKVVAGAKKLLPSGIVSKLRNR